MAEQVAEESFYKTFLKKHQNNVELMRSILRFGGEPKGACLVRVLRIKSADITSNRKFSSAAIEFMECEDFQPYNLKSVFKKGYCILDKFFSSDPDNPILPEDPRCKRALDLLLRFVDNSHAVWETLYEPDDHHASGDNKEEHLEWSWTLKLAQHVFSKLALNPSYKYDVKKSSAHECFCKHTNLLLGQKSDTSFGWEDGWHGKSDIIMAGIPVIDTDVYDDDTSSATSRESCFSIETGSGSSCESKRGDSFSVSDYRKIAAETIAFSFLKNKGFTNGISMIPSVAVSYGKVQVHLYDSIEDVFLQSSAVDIAKQKYIKLSTILLIWLSLNYDLFYTGLKKRFPVAGLHDLICVEKLSETIQAPCNLKKESRTSVVADSEWDDVYLFGDEDLE